MTRALPPEFRRHAILTSSAEEYGLTRRRLRGHDIQHPFVGASAVDLDLDLVRDRARAFLPVMEPGQTFSHTTALALIGAPLPRQSADLHVSVVFPRTPPRRPGIRGHSLAEAPAVVVDGMPVAPPVIAWAQSAALLHADDLVAVGDFLLRDATRDVLARVAESWRGRPGATRLASAADRARSGVLSRPETHLRLLLVRRRLPEPEIAYPVPVAGGVVLHPDLAYPDRRLALEYEGDGHRERAKWERDIDRRELLAEAGWRTIRVTSTHLYRFPAELVDRVRRQLGA